MNFEEHVSETVDTLFSEANRLAMSGVFPRFYLYCRPSTEKDDGALLVCRMHEDTDGLELVDGERIPVHLGRLAARHWVHQRARRAPLHATGGGATI